jgi:hypothetical protein
MPLGIVAVIKASHVKLLYEKGEYDQGIRSSTQILLRRGLSQYDLLDAQPYRHYMDSCLWRWIYLFDDFCQMLFSSRQIIIDIDKKEDCRKS